MIRYPGLLTLLFGVASVSTPAPGQSPCGFRWDPAFGVPGLAGYMGGSLTVNAFLGWDDGSGPQLYAAGAFTSIGGTSANGIARWNGQGWSALGGGFNAPGRCLAVYDDGTGTKLFAGGAFSTAGGVTVNGIARWDGAAWSSVGGGMNAVVEDLVVFDDGSGSALYASGWFTVAGTVTSNFVARWNGTTWSGLGTGLGGVSGQYGRTLCVHDDGSGPALYVGGTFLFPYVGLVRWNGATFTAVGAVPATQIESLVVHDDGSGPALYAGPQFFNATFPIRRWSGNAWTNLQGVQGNYARLFSWNDGSGPRLLVTGLSVTVTATPFPPAWIAQWNGSVWSVFGGAGTNGAGLALGAFDDGTGPALYSGGYFSVLGGVSSNRIGRWWNPTPTFFLGQPGGPGGSVFLYNNHLVTGRAYQNVVSGELCATVGTGPWLGLCATDPSFLFFQIFLPSGAVPFHFVAGSSTTSFGPYALPPGLTLDGLCFDRTGGVIGCVSPTQRFTVY